MRHDLGNPPPISRRPSSGGALRRPVGFIRAAVLLVCLIVGSAAVPFDAAHAQLRGHGGPVRALAISPDGTSAISGSFDSAAIRWSLQRNEAEQVLRFHDGAVNAVVFLGDGRIASSGEDARIAIWKRGEPQPSAVLEGHEAPVVALAVSPDGTLLASASWDRTARLWPLAGGAPRVLAAPCAERQRDRLHA